MMGGLILTLCSDQQSLISDACSHRVHIHSSLLLEDIRKSFEFNTLGKDVCLVRVFVLLMNNWADFSRSLHLVGDECFLTRMVVKAAVQRIKLLFVDGYGFDELSHALNFLALKYALSCGLVVFFDPGSRGKFLSMGTSE
ncbi:hypothetical protein AKJ16_DCAP18844 [Drosera capensis]